MSRRNLRDRFRNRNEIIFLFCPLEYFCSWELLKARQKFFFELLKLSNHFIEWNLLIEWKKIFSFHSKALKHSGENSTENFEKPNYFLMSTSKTTKQRPGDTNKGRKVSWKLTKFSILIHFECLCLLFVCGEMTHSSLNSTASQKKNSQTDCCCCCSYWAFSP